MDSPGLSLTLGWELVQFTHSMGRLEHWLLHGSKCQYNHGCDRDGLRCRCVTLDKRCEQTVRLSFSCSIIFKYCTLGAICPAFPSLSHLVVTGGFERSVPADSGLLNTVISTIRRLLRGLWAVFTPARCSSVKRRRQTILVLG
jgi:hypothetical protein